ncbi:hypothetical protein JKP88DRAFT_251699 [Tribonema minus]|uniref:Uncharacterized protein n=1 Tax=Tribonema minus TaxID=303371 RepID=A0A836CM19_9STRA|nr:hypothetical protein JKP88DRAFT_251699 [Tribonema minus]
MARTVCLAVKAVESMDKEAMELGKPQRTPVLECLVDMLATLVTALLPALLLPSAAAASLCCVPMFSTNFNSTASTDNAGRIQRGRGRPPLVIDFVDAVPLFRSMFAKRLRVYTKLGAKLTKYNENRDIIA